MKKTIVCLLAMAVVVLCQSLTACKDAGDTHEHDWEWVETAPATTQAEGLETETCKTCKATRGTKAIAKLPTSFPIIIEGFEDYPVIIKDGRTNNTAGTQLDPAILAKFVDLLQHDGISTDTDCNTVISRGLRIILQDGVEYTNYQAINGCDVGVNLDFVLQNDITTTQNRARFRTAMTAMLELPYGE